MDFIPRMINKRCQHCAVGIGNKLFVICEEYNATCEVFDSSSMKFTNVKQLKINSYEYTSAVIVGDKISIICIDEEKTKEKMFTYSAKDNE